MAAHITGTSGDDTLTGTLEADLIDGADGNDTLRGGAGDDSLLGGAGDDQLYGGDGNDTLDGGSGADILFGGQGDDHYIVRDVRDYVYDTNGKNTGLIMVDGFKPVAGVEWSWAEGVAKLPYWIDALTFDDAPQLAGKLDAQHTVYYCFAEAPTAYFSDNDRKGFQPFNESQRYWALKAMDYISSVVNVRFVATSDATTPYTIVFGNTDQDNSGAYSSPIIRSTGSTLMLDTHPLHLQPGTDGGLTITQTLLHEIGHSLYLKHPFDHPDSLGNPGPGPYLPDGEENTGYTVMSYQKSAGPDSWSYAPFDIAALQYLLGVAPSAGNNAYTISASGMNMIWDGGGYDAVSAEGLQQDVVLDLRPGHWGYVGKKTDLISAAGQVSINFGTVIEQLISGDGNDTLDGNEADNMILARLGNDRLAGHAGNDQLDGGGGRDTAVFSGLRANFTVARNGAGATVADGKGSEGKDLLVDVERLQFDDRMVALDVDGLNGQLYRLYQAAYDRKPDLAGLGYWIGRGDQGVTLEQMASAFTSGAEYTALYGAQADNASFLSKLYSNVLHRAYDQEGYDFWLKALDSGVARNEVLIHFADSDENIANLAPIIANGFDYIPFG